MTIDDLKIEKGYWYLASPYTKYPAGIATAVAHISSVAGELINRGVTVFCPISHCHPISMHGRIDPLDFELWLALDHAMMENAHGVLMCMMPTWDKSYGMEVEREYFAEMGRPVHHLTWPVLDVLPI